MLCLQALRHCETDRQHLHQQLGWLSVEGASRDTLR